MKILAGSRNVILTLSAGLLVYGVVWALTGTLAIRDLRADYESLPTGTFYPAPPDPEDREIQVLWNPVKDLPIPESRPLHILRKHAFDPDRFQPGKDEMFVYFGRFRTPGPFMASVEVATANEKEGHATRILIGWWFGERKVLRSKTFWSTKNYSETAY